MKTRWCPLIRPAILNPYFVSGGNVSRGGVWVGWLTSHDPRFTPAKFHKSPPENGDKGRRRQADPPFLLGNHVTVTFSGGEKPFGNFFVGEKILLDFEGVKSSRSFWGSCF